MRLALPFVLASQLTAPATVLVGRTGTLTGRVLPPPQGRVAAKSVWIGGVSTPVGAGGWFRATAIPSGPTRLAVETSEGLYVVHSPVTVAPGTTSSLQLVLGAREDTSAAEPSEKEKNKKRAGIWARPTSATLLIIGSAIVLGIAADQLVMSEDDEASPFVPPAPNHQ